MPDNLKDMPANHEISPDFSQSDAKAQPPLPLQEEKGLHFFTLSDVPKVFNSPWMIKGIIPFSGIGIVYGEYASGKTFLVIELALAISGGQDFFGRKVKQRPVLYFCLEGQEGFINRLAAWKKTHDEWPENAQFNTSGFDFFNLPNEEIDKFPKKSVIIIDTLNSTDPTLDENRSDGMGRVISQAKRIQGITGGLILFIHHCGKDPTKGARGHSSLMAAADVAMLVEGKDKDTRTWKIAKNKDGKAGISGKFTLQEIELGVDEDGETITSCVVQPCEALESQAKKLPQGLQEALTALKYALAEAGTDEISKEKWLEKWRQEYPIVRTEPLASARNEKESERRSFNYRCTELINRKIVAENQDMVRILSYAYTK